MGRWRLEYRWVVLTAVAAAATACASIEPPTRGCTEIGSPAGVAVKVLAEAVVPDLTLTLRVCQQACVEQRVDLSPGSTTVGQTCTSDDPDGTCSASASPDGTLLGFVDIPELAVGEVRVRGELQAGARAGPTDLAEIVTTAAPTYPNGKECSAGGPQAAVKVTATGLR